VADKLNYDDSENDKDVIIFGKIGSITLNIGGHRYLVRPSSPFVAAEDPKKSDKRQEGDKRDLLPFFLSSLIL
jgi:hypothetical protein